MRNGEVTDEQRAELGRCLVAWDTDRGGQALLVKEALREVDVAPTRATSDERWADGAAFWLDMPPTPPAIWGTDSEVFWSRGEALCIASPPGVGKTTLLTQLALRRAGVSTDLLLGHYVVIGEGKTAYIAADRPEQIRRAGHRLISEEDRAALELQLLVWPGPLPFNLSAEPEAFVPFLQEHEVGTVIIDSLGAVAFDLATDEGGARTAHAIRDAVANGIEVAFGHHDRKRGNS